MLKDDQNDFANTTNTTTSANNETAVDVDDKNHENIVNEEDKDSLKFCNEIPSPPQQDWTTKIRLDILNISSSKFAASEDTGPQSDLNQVSFLLSIFDNIVGPRIVQYWHIDSSKADYEHDDSSDSSHVIQDQLLKYISIHTLNGELYQDKLINQQKYRLYLIKEIECAIFSVFFDASTLSTLSGSLNNIDASYQHSEDHHITKQMSSINLGQQQSPPSSPLSLPQSSSKVQTSLNCFSLIVPLSKKHVLLSSFGDNTKFFINFFENMIIEYKVFAQIKPKQHQITKAINDLTKSITQLCNQMNTLMTRGLHPYSINETGETNASNSETNNSNIQTTKAPFRIHIADTFLNESCFSTTTHSINNDFLVNSITSHLITNHNTIVVGKTSAIINKMINTLGLFMPVEKLKLSCFALEESSMLSPYFYLQGYVTENPEDLNSIIDTDFLFKKDSPTTIIDLSLKCVYRTSILHEFYSQKEKFIRNKIQFLYNHLKLSDLNIVFPLQNYIHYVSSSSIIQRSTLITGLIKQMDVLETEFGVKDSYLDMFQKDVYLLALNLIEYVNNEIVNNIYKKERQVKLSMRKVCKDLDIKSEEDLNILIAHANYLKPDFSSNLIIQV